MLATKRSAGVEPEVNLRKPMKPHKLGIHLDFETQGRRNHKSKTGASVALRKGLMSTKAIFEQECIPVGCVLSALYCTWGVSLTETPIWTETPLDRDPSEGTWDQAARQEVTSYRDPTVNRMTDASKNITLPQTSFAGGKKDDVNIIFTLHPLLRGRWVLPNLLWSAYTQVKG